MGCTSSSSVLKEFLVVGTLNYCGIMNSPFEFYCKQYESQLKAISQIFISLIPSYMPQFQQKKDKFDWNMGEIDLKIRVGRYSPMFSVDVGIQNNKFMTKERFYEKWQEYFENEYKKLQIKIKYTEEQKKNTMTYDLIMFHTLLKYIYKVNSIEQASNKDPQIYIKTCKPFYNLTFLNEEKKLRKLNESFEKLQADVFFFQQYSQNLLKLFKQQGKYHISTDQSKDTMIIAKKESFSSPEPKKHDEIFEKLSQQQKRNINWAKRSSYLIIDKYIFICAHLSSKKQKNLPQIEQMKKGLIDLKRSLPDYQIIVGGDLNSYLSSFSSDYHIFPEAQQLTTVKKRTMTQGQYKKGQMLIKESKDKIISSLPFNQANNSIRYISQDKVNSNSLVPSDDHPFDHFLLMVNIDRNRRSNQIVK